MDNIKYLMKLIIFTIINTLIKQNRAIKTELITVIRLDAIGDYILFRNYLKIIKNEYKNYNITLVGNITWRSIAKELDKDFVDKFIWIDVKRFGQNLIYRYQKLKELASQSCKIIINPTYSRTFFIDDTIVKIINAKEKIGSRGDLSNIKKWQKNISDTYYTKLLPGKNEIIFEFYRHKEFFENFFNKKLYIKKPFIKIKEKRIDFELPKEYAILFVGASTNFRKWGIENFVRIGKFLKDKFRFNIVLCGGSTDIGDAKEFQEFVDYDYVDLVGKTSLIDFLHVIYNGNLMIANETSAPHFAVALDMTNIFVIYNGNHYGRFTPYPKEISDNYHVIYHPKIRKNLTNYKKLSNNYGFGSKLNINDISVQDVKQKINEVLK